MTNELTLEIFYRFSESNFPSGIKLNTDSVIIYTIIDQAERIEQSEPSAQW